jgi:lysine-N-methylase
MPWRYEISEEDHLRLESEAWIRERLQTLGTSFRPIASGVWNLPQIERNRRMVCGFLDEDDRCSIHRQMGEAALAHVCRAFPVDFLKENDGTVTPLLSHLCPSIRDNYGDPLEQKLPAFREAVPAPKLLPDHFELGGSLPGEARALLEDFWIRQLQTRPLREGLSRILEGMEKLSEERSVDNPPPLEDLLRQVEAGLETEPTVPTTPSLLGRLLLAFTLAPMAHPLRLMDLRGRGWSMRLALFRIMKALVQERGRLDLLMTPGEVELKKASEIVSPVLEATLEADIRRFLLIVIRRRDLFLRHSDATRAVLHLTLALVVISRFARIHAAASGRDRCELKDVREGISAAEFSVLFHGSNAPQGSLLDGIYNLAAQNPLTVRNLLALA